MPLRNFKIRLGPFCECHNVGVHCKELALCQQMRFTRHKSTQNLVRFPVYFLTFLIFVQRSNYHWSCFRSMRKKLHHKFKNKYIMPQNVIERWRKCKNRFWIWCTRNCSFFLANISSLKGVPKFFKKKYLCHNKSIKKISLYVHVISLSQDRTLGNPGEYLWEYKWINWVPCPWGV